MYLIQWKKKKKKRFPLPKHLCQTKAVFFIMGRVEKGCEEKQNMTFFPLLFFFLGWPVVRSFFFFERNEENNTHIHTRREEKKKKAHSLFVYAAGANERFRVRR